MKQKNILLLYPDQLRPDFLGALGQAPVETPHIDQLIARGTYFDQCRSSSPLCIPMRACLTLASRYGKTGCDTNEFELDPARPNIFQALREAGYQTLSCGKSDIHGHVNHFSNAGYGERMRELGFTAAYDQRGKLNSARQPLDRECAYMEHLRRHELLEIHHEDYEKRAALSLPKNDSWPSPLPREHYTDDFTGQNALKLLQDVPDAEPWFLWVNFPGPHDPWDAPADLLARYQDVDFTEPVQGDSAYDHQAVRRNYAAMITGIDEWVGRILEQIKARGELEDTLIIFSSDHGEMLGDHGLWLKSTWREGSVKVPLIVSGPGFESGKIDSRPVEGIDMAASICEAAGVPLPENSDAVALTAQPRAWQYSALKAGAYHGNWQLVCDGAWKYVRHEGADLLFNLQEDPHELSDKSQAEPEILDALKGRLTEDHIDWLS